MQFAFAFTHLKRAVAKDRGEDGSGQHGEDGQDHRHAVCGGRCEELLFWERHHMDDKYIKDREVLNKMK